MTTLHERAEMNSFWLIVFTLIVVSIGGIVQMVPLFFMESTIEKVAGMRPYTPLELMGRNIYIREGCYLCHSQQVRPFRDEAERYGHYSLAAESMYDHPFQWGSKRTGPDLARVGLRYSDDWHVAHLIDPRAVVPESVMPGYRFLSRQPLDFHDAAAHLRANRAAGVPYSDDMIKNAVADIASQTMPDGDAKDAFMARYPKAQVRKFHAAEPREITEMDALVAYLQMLGTLVDFSTYDAAKNLR